LLAWCATATAQDTRALEAGVAASDLRNEAIRDRMRDYEAKLQADLAQKVREWNESFLSHRNSRLTNTVDTIISLGESIRLKGSLDADQLKTNVEFKKVLEDQIAKTLDAEALKGELQTWAKGVELQTRARLIECFQQIIAEDLGRSFDEKLRGKVVEAVKAIPIDLLIADRTSTAKLEASILDALPAAALSAETRRQVSAAVAVLAKCSATVFAQGHGLGQLSPLLGEAVGEIARLPADAALRKMNEAMTAKPDPNLLRGSLERALADWNKANLQSRLEEILRAFGKEAVKHVEAEARNINYLGLP